MRCCFTMLLFSVVSTALLSSARAGVVNGGGGKVVVCRNADRSIKTAELLDLWESKHLYGREILPSTKSTKELVIQSIERLKFVLLPGLTKFDGGGAYVKASLDRYTQVLRGDSPASEARELRRLRGVVLSLTEDSFEIARPSDCEIEQVINYVDQAGLPKIYINQDLYDALDSVNQAALILHEGLYTYLRTEFGEANSIRTRRAVGIVMAGESFRSTYDLLKPSHITCTSANEQTRFHVVSFFPDWGDTREEMFSIFIEKVAGLPTMGFERFNWGIGGTLDQLFTEMFDPATPIPQPLPYNHLPVSLGGMIEPELEGLFNIEGQAGEKRRVMFEITARVGGRTPLPYSTEVVCAKVPAL